MRNGELLKGAMVAACVSLLGVAGGQESLDTLLDRGYVTHWLVCGPFQPDVEGGIVEAIQRGDRPLGDRDYMAPIGGVARIRPKHLLAVSTPDGDALWQKAGERDPTLDLKPFFPDATEGVAFAAFYAQTNVERTAYFEVQSVLGARVYLNGFLLRNIRAEPVALAGVDRFLVTFRPGLNLLVFEVPGARLEALAQTAGMTLEDFKRRAFAQRHLLTGSSGFEIAVQALPARPVGDLFYVAKLEHAGSFSGLPEALRQDALLTLFNAGNSPSPPVTVRASAGTLAKLLVESLAPLPAGQHARVRLSIPVGDLARGQGLPVDIAIEAGDAQAQFTSSINVREAPQEGTVYVLTGAYYRPERAQDQAARTQIRIASLEQQTALLACEPDYGFVLGDASHWRPFLAARPGSSSTLSEALATGRCGASAGFAEPDERIVSGEVLARNLAYGRYAALGLLGTAGRWYDAWDAPALSPQTPQLLKRCAVEGVLSNLDVLGVPELFWHQSLDGTKLLHRRKKPSPAFTSVETLRAQAWIQRRELLERGLDTDVLVNEPATPPPQPYLVNNCTGLAQEMPSIRVRGSGAVAFFEDTSSALRDAAQIPAAGRLMNAYEPGALIAQVGVKRAFAETETLTLTAEKFATFAALLGADYPEASLDFAWRQILFNSTPDRLGFARIARDYLDALAGLRETAAVSREVLAKATGYIAAAADTYAGAPTREEGVTALVVFNPSSWTRTDVCKAHVVLSRASGLTLLDELGTPVPFHADRLEITNRRLVGAYIRFVANDVPALGYRTYYVQPQGTVPEPSQGAGAQIENDLFRVMVDPKRGGGVISLVDKATGREFVSRPLNEAVALEEDLDRTNGGRDLWTTGVVARSGGEAAQVTRTKYDWMQRLTVSTPFLDGTLIRELTVYEGVPRVDCQLRLEGVSNKALLYAVAFPFEAGGRVPVFGERFGAVVGRCSPGVFEFKSEGAINHSGAGVQPALRWAASSPNDRIQAGPDIAVPLGPCAIVHGNAPILERAAREVQSAMMGRGIPSSTRSDTPRKLNTVWTDSTELPNLNDDLNYGTAMRILLGGPDDNLEVKRVMKGLGEDELAGFRQAMDEGATLLIEDYDVPEGFGPVPTLILAANNPRNTVRRAEAFAEAIRTHGVYRIPADACAVDAAAPQPETGLAVLFTGAGLASLERDGTLFLLLEHGSALNSEPEDLPYPLTGPSRIYRYALHPFAGTWREAAVPQAADAFNEPFAAAQTDLRLGICPTRESFLEPQDPNFIVSCVKPAGWRIPAMRSDGLDPRNGIVARGHECTGTLWEANMAFFAPLRNAAFADPLDRIRDALAYDDSLIVPRINAFAVETLWLLPTARIRRGPAADLEVDQKKLGPVFTRYWLHNAGAAPFRFLPLSLLVAGDIDTGGHAARVTIRNNLTDERIEGRATLTAAKGWRAVPAEFDYKIEPGESVTENVLLLSEVHPLLPPGLMARTIHNGQTYVDVLQGGGAPLECEVKRFGAEIRVDVANHSGLPLEGWVDLIAPADYWPELGANPAFTAGPFRALVSVGPFQNEVARFRLSDAAAPGLFVVKLSANGRVVYRNVPTSE